MRATSRGPLPEYYRIIVRRGLAVLEVIEHMPVERLGRTLARIERRYGEGD